MPQISTVSSDVQTRRDVAELWPSPHAAHDMHWRKHDIANGSVVTVDAAKSSSARCNIQEIRCASPSVLHIVQFYVVKKRPQSCQAIYSMQSAMATMAAVELLIAT